MSDSFYRLKDSPWMFCVQEVGAGLPFSNYILSRPGASSIILKARSDYVDCTLPGMPRAVGKENTLAQAHSMRNEAALCLPQNKGRKAAGLALISAHYDTQPSHGWVALQYDTDQRALAHIEVTGLDRKEFGRLMQKTAWCLINAALLGQNAGNEYQELLRHMHGKAGDCDVFELPSFSLAEFITIRKLQDGTTMAGCFAWKDGALQRIRDWIRRAPAFCPGSFNPPHGVHNRLFPEWWQDHDMAFPEMAELSMTSHWKGSISVEDTVHRLRMIDLHFGGRIPVLVTWNAPLFIDKITLLKSLGLEEMEFNMGSDVAAELFTPVGGLLTQTREALAQASYGIVPRDGKKPRIPQGIQYAWLDSSSSEASSSCARDGGESTNHLEDGVRAYIDAHGLYDSSECQEAREPSGMIAEP